MCKDFAWSVLLDHDTHQHLGDDGQADDHDDEIGKGQRRRIPHLEFAQTLDEDVEKDDVFGSVEAVKTVSDLFMPLTGKVIEFNEKLEEDPELVNTDPYGEGWMIKINISDPSEINTLLDAAAYQELV